MYSLTSNYVQLYVYMLLMLCQTHLLPDSLLNARESPLLQNVASVLLQVETCFEHRIVFCALICEGLCAEEIHVCGEPAAINFIRELMYSTGEEVEVMMSNRRGVDV